MTPTEKEVRGIKVTNFSCHLPRVDFESLDKLAKRQDRSRAAVVRQLIRQAAVGET